VGGVGIGLNCWQLVAGEACHQSTGYMGIMYSSTTPTTKPARSSSRGLAEASPPNAWTARKPKDSHRRRGRGGKRYLLSQSEELCATDVTCHDCESEDSFAIMHLGRLTTGSQGGEMNDKNPFASVLELKPISANLAQKSVSEVSYPDIVKAASDWLPRELVDAFDILQAAGFTTESMAKSLSVILALLRGELRTKPAIERWFLTGQVEVSRDQGVSLATIGRYAREIVRISERLRELVALMEEKESEFRSSSGKQKERVGAAMDRAEKQIASLESKRRKVASELDQDLRMVADYLGVGGTR